MRLIILAIICILQGCAGTPNIMFNTLETNTSDHQWKIHRSSFLNYPVEGCTPFHSRAECIENAKPAAIKYASALCGKDMHIIKCQNLIGENTVDCKIRCKNPEKNPIFRESNYENCNRTKPCIFKTKLPNREAWMVTYLSNQTDSDRCKGFDSIEKCTKKHREIIKNKISSLCKRKKSKTLLCTDVYQLDAHGNACIGECL